MGMLSKALSFETPERPARAASQNCLTPTADTTPSPVTTVRGLNADFSWLPLDSRYDSGPLAWCRRMDQERLNEPMHEIRPRTTPRERARPSDGLRRGRS